MAVDVRGSSADASAPRLNHHGVRSWAGGRFRQELSNWRLFLVRIITSALAVVLTVLVIPGLHFTSWGWGRFTLIGLVFGLLNAVVKPALQFFALRYLVASYGLVVVLINAALLALLAWVLGGAIEARGVVPLLLGGALVGFFGLVLDSLCGTTPPIRDSSARQANDRQVAS